MPCEEVKREERVNDCMKNHRSLISILLLVFLVSLTACGGGGDQGGGAGSQADGGSQAGGGVASASPDEFVSYTIGVSDYLGRFLAGLTPTEAPAATSAVFDQILKTDPKTKALISDCLEDWGWEDDTTFVMKLRPGVIFSNGAEATAEDLVYSYTSYPMRGSTNLNSLGLIWDECYARDRYTGVFKFERPLRTFTNSSINLICKEWSEEVGWESLDWYYPVGSGPYTCVDFVSEDIIRLKARDDWWGEALYGPIYVDEWVIKYYKDASTMYMDLEVGKIDFCEVQATDYSRYLKNGGNGFEAIMLQSGVVMYLTMSQVDRPDIWTNKRIREAVAIGVNWDELGGVVQNELFIPAKSMLPQLAPNFIDPGGYEYNPEKARQILAEEGYGPNNPIKLFTTLMDSQLYKAFGENVQFQFSQIGIDLAIDFVDIATAINVAFAPGGTDIGLFWSIGGSPSFDLYAGISAAVWATGATHIYIPEEDNPEFYALFNRMTYTSDVDDANLAMKELQQYIHDDYTYLPFAEMTGAFGYRTDKFSEEQLRRFVNFVNMYLLGSWGLASAWQ